MSRGGGVCGKESPQKEGFRMVGLVNYLIHVIRPKKTGMVGLGFRIPKKTSTDLVTDGGFLSNCVGSDQLFFG